MGWLGGWVIGQNELLLTQVEKGWVGSGLLTNILYSFLVMINIYALTWLQNISYHCDNTIFQE